MKKISRYLIVFLVMIIIFIQSLLVYKNLQCDYSNDNILIQSKNNVAKVYFNSQYNNMSTIGILFDKIDNGNINVELTNDNKLSIFNKNLSAISNGSDGYKKIKFNAIENSSNQRYCLTITFSSNVNSSEIRNLNDKIHLITLHKFISYDRLIIFLILDLVIIVYSSVVLKFGLIKVNTYVYKLRFVLLILLFITTVLLKVNLSSIAIWESTIHSNKSDFYKVGILFGKPRPIRSDEWLVQTPMYLAQGLVKGNSYPLINKNISTNGTNMIISSYSPTKDILTIGKPFNWGFLFLKQDYGFSWYWMSKVFLLFIFSFEICMILTKKNKGISLFGAIIILFSSTIQWWLSTGVVDLIVFSQMIIVNLNWYMYCNKWYAKILFCIGIIIGGTGFFFNLYPPLQIPLGIMTLIFIFYIFKSNDNYKKLKNFDYFMCFSIVSILFLFVFHFYKVSIDQIKLMQDTVYPGKRISVGGGEPIERLLYYLLSWKMPFKDITLFSNNSEASSFFSLFPFIPGIFLFVNNKIFKENNLIKYLLYFLGFQILWMFIAFPEWFAKISLLYYVTNARLEIVFGLTCLYLLVMYLSLNEKVILKCSVTKILIMINIFLIIFVFKSNIYLYLGRYFTILTLIYINAIIILILKKKQYIAVFLISLFVIVSGIFVNPIAKGLDSVYNNKASEEIIQIASSTNGTWVGANDITLGNYLIAHGVKSYNCVNFYPDFSKWVKIDTSGKYKDIYNRYSHIIVSFTYEETTFVLNGPDYFTVNMNYNDLYNKTDIEYILSRGKIDEKSKFNFLKELYYDKESDLYFYKIERNIK